MQTLPAHCVQQFVHNDSGATSNSTITEPRSLSTASSSSQSSSCIVPILPLLLSPSIHSSLTEAQLKPNRCKLRKRNRETTVNASNQSDVSDLKDADKPALVEIPSNDSTRTAACSRNLCCNSFSLTSSAPLSPSSSSSPSVKQTLTLYWCPHRVETQHFDMPQSDVERELRARLSRVDDELHELQQKKQRVDHHIKVLHDYNEIKDVVQALMGKCAEMEGATTKDMYEKFGLDLDD